MTGRSLRRVPLLAAAGALLLAGSGSGRAAHRTCCFNNPQYAGVCEVSPSKGETCASILAYLNNPAAQGKTYCSNSGVRVGWKQVACGGKKAAGGRDPDGARPLTAGWASRPARPAR